jgi:hypothetical protein
MLVTEYDVGPGAYGVALAADGAVWTSLTGRGELARVGPDGQVAGPAWIPGRAARWYWPAATTTRSGSAGVTGGSGGPGRTARCGAP